ncbi:ArfGap-domain-containing protein [Coniochaeta ligniaria NRRL 30616]|uniref:ArfGap-domain-containing protein n=1 Tax=Coniochaeta ligniaria NRRL 30616 TaxID=1408157 RepID=A0A1J7ID93_9PEZI|nr:ArfGap-domain-containing protein [Coniochaeta ligniaria NRRL 30616]
MSRRPPNPAAERAAQNQQTLKSLIKLECNKVCADCKRNKHPRWASWNLGVFVCIRCSGIHRGMGTHISRVKSVDLDSWTDEQLASILSWGNARANKYWEAKLAPGHVPSEAKIENFIRTKYELKRWVMDGPMPDPATLDVDGDDDVPLSVVKEKQNLDRRETARKASTGQASAPRSVAPPPVADLIGGDMPPRATSAGPGAGKVPPKANPAPPKTTSTKDSLLGLDFLGTETAAPPRPASTTGTPGAATQSRPDLKQSILSLYATAPRPQPPQQQTSHISSPSFGGMQSPGFGHQPQGSVGGLNDAFSSLSFGASPPPQIAPKSPQNDAFASLGGFSSSRPAAHTNTSAFSSLSGGGFFDPKPASSAPSHQPKPSTGSLSGFGAFSTPAAPAAAPKPTSSGLDDLFDFSTPASPPPAPQTSNLAPQPSTVGSVFNLTPAQPKPQPAAAVSASLNSNLSGADVWGGNAWATPETSKKSPEIAKPAAATPAGNDFGWGSFASQSIVPGASGGFAPAPKVAADEEFGGWASSTGPPAAGAAKPSGLGNDDLFSNVWE